MIPVLETERLILREYRLEDFPFHVAISGDPATMQAISDNFRAFDEEQCWLRFLRNIGMWQLFGYGWWGLEEKITAQYVGTVGFFQSRRAIDNIPYRDAPEAAWMLAPDRRGKGLASEALRAAMAWCDANIAASETWCMIATKNIASQKTAERFGYRPAANALYKGEEMLTFLRPRGGQA